MIALSGFRLAAYVRSHRVHQALLPILAVLAVVYATRAPAGQEAAVLADSAVMIVPFLAWAARSVLDTEPDRQREMSAVLAGGRGRELAAGLLAALAACATFAGLALAWGVLLGMSAGPPGAVLAAGIALHALSTLTGLTLGALTSRALLPSPALSIMALVSGFVAMLLISASPLPWLTVPLTVWMREAGADRLVAQLPGLGAVSLAWCLLGLTAYAWLRRTRP
ncbi:hypothetical protein [Nonomuraea sp. NPDC048826]|uniref:hypothetical protein n=1 Tax=Nonomuraea sp. NPDC048826 TaxID=3364347 RepID=UPI0037109A94